MPLVPAGRAASHEPASEAEERARKVRPQYARGELVRVTGGRNQAEAELIQGMLLEEGIPSVLRRARGFDVPDFLAAGPRDVMVPEGGYEAARTMLADADLLTIEGPTGSIPGVGTPTRLLVGVLAAVALAFALVWILYQATA
jgi:hypothetical protein